MDLCAVFTIADILADLTNHHARVPGLVDAADPDDVRTLVRLLPPQAQIASRMGHLLNYMITDYGDGNNDNV